jgi:CxxC-x17-CxxC domain-containing protein
MANEELDNNVVYFARTDFRNANRLFGIKRSDRRQHTYVVGKTGTGKSAFLHNMIIQDIANGEGLCVVDPHGELVEGILDKIPEERMKDVIYFNPADTEFHVGFNILELPDPKYKHLVASGLMGIFTKIWSGVWSPRMEYILNNCVLALLDTPGSTLLGIPRLLTDKDYRQKIIANVKDPVVKAFWIHEFEGWQDRFRNEAIAPIQNKVGQFLSTSLVRNVVGQSKSTIDIFNIMNEGKIFLVNVSKGRIGEDNSALLGAMLITKIQLAAMERVRIPEDERVDFYLYVDEFQNFATDSFAGILSEARKYRLDLIVAHQYIGQLVTDKSTIVRDAIFGNVGTMVIFRVGAADAEFLENEFTPEFTIEDIVNLPNYHIYIKLMCDGITARPFSAETLPPFKVKTSVIAREDIEKMSQKYYARPREVVEAEINRWSGVMDAGSQTAFAGTGIGAAIPGAGGPTSGPGGGGGGSERIMGGPTGIRYQAVCSACGNTTSLPFEPTPGRPVYCRDCMKKIESGEMKPIRTNWQATQRNVTTAAAAKPKEKYTDALSALGIEFTGETTAKPTPAASTAPTSASGGSAPARPRPRPSSPRPAVESPTPSGAATTPSRPTTPEPQANQVEQPEPQETISLNELRKPAERTSKANRAPRTEVSISALRDAIKASLNQDIVASDSDNGDNSGNDGSSNAASSAPDAKKPDSDENEDDDYEKDRSYRGR